MLQGCWLHDLLPSPGCAHWACDRVPFELLAVRLRWHGAPHSNRSARQREPAPICRSSPRIAPRQTADASCIARGETRRHLAPCVWWRPARSGAERRSVLMEIMLTYRLALARTGRGQTYAIRAGTSVIRRAARRTHRVVLVADGASSRSRAAGTPVGRTQIVCRANGLIAGLIDATLTDADRVVGGQQPSSRSTSSRARPLGRCAACQRAGVLAAGFTTVRDVVNAG